MAEKILIIDDDLDTLRLVGLMLQKQGYQIAAANNGQQGLYKVDEDKPDLILLDVMMPDMDGYEVARRLRQNPETAQIPILMFTAKSQLDDKVTGFESGADDYLTKPTHPTELHAHVKALLTRSAKTQDAETDVAEKKAFVVGVVSVRGSLGVSTISLNLGGYLQSEAEAETVVVEVQPGLGTMGRNLGFEGYEKFSDLLQGASNEISAEKVKSAFHKHKSGLQILLASEHPHDAPLIETVSHYNAVFSQLTRMPRFLIMDFGASLPRVNQTLLPQCDHVIVVIEGFSNTILHSKLLLEDLQGLGIDEKKLSIVLNNRMRSDLLLSLSQVEERLGEKVAVTFTPAPELHAQAARLNTIGILDQPDSITTQQFKKLAELMIQYEADEE